MASALLAQDAPVAERGYVPSPVLQKYIDANAFADGLPIAKAEMAACEAALVETPDLGKAHCFLIRQETLHLAISVDDNAYVVAEAERLLADATGDTPQGLEARLTAINLLSVAYGDLGDFEAAARYLHMDLEESRRIFGANSEEVAISFLNLGVFYDHKLRQHEKGLGYYQQAEAALRAGGFDRGEYMPMALGHQARALDNMGLPYQSGALYRRAIALEESLPIEQQSGLAIRRQNYATTLNQVGDWREAQRQLRLALVELERMYGPDSSRIIIARQSLAVGYFMQGRYSDAAAIFDANWAQSLAKEDTTQMTYISLWQARLALARGDYAKAEQWLDRNADLVAALPTDFPVMRLQAGLERVELAYARRDFGAMQTQLTTLSVLADADVGQSDRIAVRQWWAEWALSTGDAEQALNHLRAAREMAGATMPADAPLLIILDGKMAYALSIIDPQSDAALQMMEDAAKRAAQSMDYGPAALARNRGPVTSFTPLYLDHLDMIRRAGGAIEQAMSPAYALFNSSAAGAGLRLQRLRTANNADLAAKVRDRDIVREQLRALDRDAQGEARAQAVALTREEAELTAAIAALDPQFDAHSPVANADLAAIQTRLIDGDLALVMVEDARRGYHIWAITRDTAQWQFVADPDGRRLQPALSVLHSFYGNQAGAALRGQAEADTKATDPNAFERAQADVAAYLLGPIADTVRAARHIHVISTGAAGTIPLASLPLDTGYVADVAPVSRYSSLTAFVAAQRSGEGAIKPPSDMRAMAIAPDYSRIAGFAQLPFAVEQMAYLDSIGFAALDRLSGRDASEHAVKRHAGFARSDLILFASHSVYVEGEGPAFVLHDGEGEDGRLTSDEIALLPSRAMLVILSACSTAAADPDEGDPLSGLARGFLTSGSRGVVISHWPVEDKAAAHIGSAMIRHLADHPDATPAQALRHAALSLRAEGGRYAHPRYWAAFSLLEE